MSFMLEPDETPGAGLARAIGEQTDKLRRACERTHEEPAVFARQARVRAKKIRAALRLARPLMKDKAFRAANKGWRDAARELSDLRDAGARIEALEALRPFLTSRIGAGAVQDLSQRLVREHVRSGGLEAIARFAERFAALKSAGSMDIEDGDLDDMADALKETYRAARRAMQDARGRDADALHEWRKQTKYHVQQLRLLRARFPGAFEERIGLARELADLLGEVQDIEILQLGAAALTDAPEAFSAALRDRRHELAEAAEGAGARLFAEKPGAFARRLRQAEACAQAPATRRPLSRDA